MQVLHIMSVLPWSQPLQIPCLKSIGTTSLIKGLTQAILDLVQHQKAIELNRLFAYILMKLLSNAN